MCYGCRPTCDDCKPKFVYCPACGRRNFLFSRCCSGCGRLLDDEEKAAAREQWRQLKEQREVSG